ncbi:solute carrier organic anion transporter family member 2A1 [Hermetia illucens]|uniref:solute carrier organic anion transporter family member 2A1 n=1 Tax=Hermetia illucens TaxID=343691 RepID=UPI0018CC5C05|nr:solute carrier organic anion transporter family member 2A1 [Hermetia illucens]XP_037902518.1 solute carrier organic anion transporter family member 2A1 [Hermetia illucens]
MDRRETTSMQPIQADANNIPKGSIDCGVQAIGCCNGPGCQKLGTIRTFLIIFSITGILQGAVDSYFRISVKQAALDYGFDAAIVDWLLAANSIAQSIIAIFITHWASKFHHMSWLGCLTMIQALGCIMVIVPTISSQNLEGSSTSLAPITPLCQKTANIKFTNGKPYAVDTLVLLFILQLGTSLGATVFYTLGFTYLDDNAELVDSPALIGTALAARFWGPQFGSAVSLAVNATPFTWWLGWTVIAPSLFILGFLLTLFPRRLLKTVIKMAANRIIETNNLTPHQPAKFIEDVNLWPSLKRLFQNRILILNILAMMFIQAASMNYLNSEQDYLKSRFFVPSNEASGLINEWTSRFLANLLKPPTIALTVLVAGLIIAKINPSARSLTIWNISIGVITCLLYVSYIFIKCPNVKMAATMGNKIMQPFCASSCECPQNLQFLPVCPQGSIQTYFSPCHAGCSSQTVLNDVTIYQNCTCGADSSFTTKNILATEGACNYKSCQKMWIVFQTMVIFSAALLSSGIIGRIIISLRSVLTQDKSLALALELTMVGLFTYIPTKIGYYFVSVYTCQFQSVSNSECELHQSPLHGNILNIISASLILIAIILDCVLLAFVKYLDCYHDTTEESFRTLPLRAISSNSRYEELTENGRDEQDGSFVDSNSPLIHSIQSTQPSFRGTSNTTSENHEESPSRALTADSPVDSNTEHLDFNVANGDNNTGQSTDETTGPSNIYSNTQQSRKNVGPTSPETDF